MPSLTHVQILSEHGWKKIDVSEAAAQFPSTVHARGRMLMCELCHQYVTFTRPGAQDRHFRHTPDEDKSCPERTFSASTNTNCSIKEHDLPIRLKHDSSDFRLEIGLLGVPESVFEELQDHTIQISPSGKSEPITYLLKERLREDQITYVPISSIPFPEYRIQLDCRNFPAFSFWPERVRGIDPAGTLFDEVSGKKLPFDADIQIKKPYLLLQNRPIPPTPSSISLQQILFKSVSKRYWYLYEVSANALDKDAAKFFLRFHCRLTDQPVSIQPIWPIYTKGPYAIHHNSQEMVFYVRGDVTTNCYPPFGQRGEQIVGRGRLEFIRCSDKQQLISAGHEYKLADDISLRRRLKYTYLWKEPLDKAEPLPSVSVTDITGQDVLPGLADRLPPQSILRISAPYDGSVTIRKQGCVIEKRRLKAEIPSEITSIRFGYELEIFQGLDRVWAIQYQRKHQQAENENMILKRLKSVDGPSIPVPHAWGAVAEYLEDYPHVKQWLYQRIREGSMSVSAYHELKCLIERLAMK